MENKNEAEETYFKKLTPSYIGMALLEISFQSPGFSNIRYGTERKKNVAFLQYYFPTRVICRKLF